MRNRIILPIIGLALTGVILYGSASVSAQTDNNPVSPLVQKIAQKFNLNEADVKAVFDQDKQDHINQMQSNYETKLTQLVNDGKITEAQKQLILTKMKELETNRQAARENMKNMTPEQRKTEMQKQKTELEAWAKTNNIDLQYLRFGKGFERGHFGMKGKPTATPNSQ